jgi:hypothetical protein
MIGTMAETPKDVAYRLDALAGIVRSELTAAGLPVVPDDHPLGTAGAVVQVDLPEPSGVLVGWHAHPILMDAGQAAWADDPMRRARRPPRPRSRWPRRWDWGGGNG